jgi:hypothetical protein
VGGVGSIEMRKGVGYSLPLRKKICFFR